MDIFAADGTTTNIIPLFRIYCDQCRTLKDVKSVFESIKFAEEHVKQYHGGEWTGLKGLRERGD